LRENWNYGRNPAANVQRSQCFAGGAVDVPRHTTQPYRLGLDFW